MGSFITGSGQIMKNVHALGKDCLTYGCSIHNPTDPNKHLPTYWRLDRYLMERICPCGIGHPDKDHITFMKRTKGDNRALIDSVHGCCGIPEHCWTAIKPDPKKLTINWKKAR